MPGAPRLARGERSARLPGGLRLPSSTLDELEQLAASQGTTPYKLAQAVVMAYVEEHREGAAHGREVTATAT